MTHSPTCRRHVVPAALVAAALLVWSRPTDAQTLADPPPSRSLSTEKTLVDPATLKITPSLHVPDQYFDPGTYVALVALLLDDVGRGIRDKTITFQVRDGMNALVKSCTGTTDFHGRAHCYFKIPQVGGAPRYSLKASATGDSRYEPATGSGTLFDEKPAHRGGLVLPGGPLVRVGPIEGMAGRLVNLRATVMMGQKPVTSGQVRFWANGSKLGSARVDASGLARVLFPLESRHLTALRPIFSQQARIGPIMAWYEPPAGSTLKPGLGIGRGWFGNDLDTCRRREYPPDHRCSVATENPSSLQTKIGVFTVYRSRYGEVDIAAQPRVTITFPKPPDPPPNADCIENYGLPEGPGVPVAGVPYGFCDRSCERLELHDWNHMGFMGFLRIGPPDSTPPSQVCSWKREVEARLNSEDYRVAHDLCEIKARQLGLSDWSHTVNTTLPHWFSASFRFRNPHTIYQSGGWKALLNWENLVREAIVQLPVSINCRN